MEHCNNVSTNTLAFNDGQNKENIYELEQNEGQEVDHKNIIHQCEFYFSDANILKDQFLLKHIKSSGEGWVDLKLVENFKKMKALSSDHDVIVCALQKSNKVEVSGDGSKIRRRDPLPEWDKSIYKRSIIISDFTDSSGITYDSVSEVFQQNGCPPILTRVLARGRNVPFDLKRSQALHPQLGSKLCVVVEFLNQQDAAKAISIAGSHWKEIYVKLLSSGNKKAAAATKKNTAKSTVIPLTLQRPLFRVLDLSENQNRVTHLRQPIGPPTEDSVGFAPGWRDALCLQRLKVENEVNRPEAPPCEDGEVMPSDAVAIQ